MKLTGLAIAFMKLIEINRNYGLLMCFFLAFALLKVYDETNIYLANLFIVGNSIICYPLGGKNHAQQIMGLPRSDPCLFPI